MSKKYVPEGVYLACNKGTCSSQLRVSNNKKTSIYGSPMATEADLLPFFNLKPMGFCTNPLKILTTGVMCVPTITKWEDTKEGITINGNKMLLENSTCKCILGGGDISIHFDITSANQVAVWGGAKMPTEYIKDGFDWAFANMNEDRAARDAMLPDWMQGVTHVGDWFEDLTVGLVEGAVTGVVGLGEVIYQVAQDPVGMTEAVGGMLSDADAWVKEKEMQALVWASDGENWSNAAESLWKTTTETDWTQTISDGASVTWQGTKDAASWVTDNPRKIGTTVGEFIPDAVAVVYSGGTALALTGAKKVGKEIAEEVVEKVVKEGLEEAGEKTAKAGTKKALKEGGEALLEKKAGDIAKVVTSSLDSKIDDALKKFDASKATNKQKGNFGEMAAHKNHMKNKNLTRLGDDPPSDLNDKIKKGIDGIYENADPLPKFIIEESKYGTSRLGKTKDGKQMSNKWITGSKRLENQVGIKKAREIKKALKNNEVERVLSKIDKTGKVTTQKLDKFANIIK